MSTITPSTEAIETSEMRMRSASSMANTARCPLQCIASRIGLERAVESGASKAQH